MRLALVPVPSGFSRTLYRSMRYEVQLCRYVYQHKSCSLVPFHVVPVFAISTIQRQPPFRLRLANGCSVSDENKSPPDGLTPGKNTCCVKGVGVLNAMGAAAQAPRGGWRRHCETVR